MKRRHLNKQPGLGDFKNKCSEMVKLYDAKIIRVIFETIHESVYWNGLSPRVMKRDILQKLEMIFKKQKVSVMHLDPIVSEILAYFGRFLILLDSDKRIQN